jgi:hypothetical protein
MGAPFPGAVVGAPDLLPRELRGGELPRRRLGQGRLLLRRGRRVDALVGRFAELAGERSVESVFLTA